MRLVIVSQTALRLGMKIQTQLLLGQSRIIILCRKRKVKNCADYQKTQQGRKTEANGIIQESRQEIKNHDTRKTSRALKDAVLTHTRLHKE